MSEAEQRRPLISRIRHVVLGKRVGTISSAVRNIDSTATYGHQDLDAELLKGGKSEDKGQL